MEFSHHSFYYLNLLFSYCVLCETGLYIINISLNLELNLNKCPHLMLNHSKISVPGKHKSFLELL